MRRIAMRIATSERAGRAGLAWAEENVDDSCPLSDAARVSGRLTHLARLLAIGFAICLACVGPQRSGSGTSRAEPAFSAASHETKLVFAAPGRSADLQVPFQADYPRPTWFDRLPCAAPGAGSVQRTQTAGRRAAELFFRPATQGDRIELRV